MKQVIIAHNGHFVQGFSLKTQRVYTTHIPAEAKRFSAVGAQQFLHDYANVADTGFHSNNVELFLVRKGEVFDPFKGDKK